jgi:hypothetical protein
LAIRRPPARPSSLNSPPPRGRRRMKRGTVRYQSHAAAYRVSSPMPGGICSMRRLSGVRATPRRIWSPTIASTPGLH